MSNVFTGALNNSQDLQNKLLGPTYPYYKNIKMPSQIGMSDYGSLQQVGRNVDGLVDYVEVLVTGNSRASATGRPLGNKFFLKTGAKCQDVKSNNQVDRYIYVNNVPEGNIPFISQGLGVNFSEFRGLIPGAMGNLNVLNPYGIMSSFLAGSTPPCQEITMQTIDVNNNSSSETHYVTLSDIGGMDPCIFPNRINPLNGNRCQETFETQNLNQNNLNDDEFIYGLPMDPLAQVYFAGLAGVGIYILYRLMNKAN